MEQMTDQEKFLFDLQGFIVVPGALTPGQVGELNAAIDANRSLVSADNRGDGGSRTLSGDATQQLSGLLTLAHPWCVPFRSLLCHSPVRPYLNTLLGRGWRMDAAPQVFLASKGSQGLLLHGNGRAFITGASDYQYVNGTMRCGMISVQYALADVRPGDGGFACIPGSHKANFVCPPEILRWEQQQQVVTNPPVRAGDMLIFNEAMIHGALPWRAEHERRTLMYRYSPKYLNWSAPHHTVAPEWFHELTEQQRAVLEPPYIYNRPLLDDNGAIERPFFEW